MKGVGEFGELRRKSSSKKLTGGFKNTAGNVNDGKRRTLGTNPPKGVGEALSRPPLAKSKRSGVVSAYGARERDREEAERKAALQKTAKGNEESGGAE